MCLHLGEKPWADITASTHYRTLQQPLLTAISQLLLQSGSQH